MRKIYQYISALVLIMTGLALPGCQNEYDAIKAAESDGDALIVKGSILIPELSAVVSRGILGETPNSDLKLTVLEFGLGTDATNSFLTNVYQAELQSTSQVNNGGVVNFKFKANASSSAKVLHFMLADEFISPESGSVATILPSLTSGIDSKYGEEAYWGYKMFPNGLIETDDNGDTKLIEGVNEALTKVPLIRNFAKVSVSCNLDNFTLLGYELINVPNAGTIAPWNQSKLAVPELLDGSSMKPYKEIDYDGIVASDAWFVNTENFARDYWNERDVNSTEDRYIYEHPYESIRRTYLIVYGQYQSGTTVTPGFYKVDIGHWENGVFKYYNLLRNIHYKITITSVSAAGMKTVAEAINATPFNNITAEAETSNMLSVSDGVNLLAVDDKNHIIVDDDVEITVLYRYIEHIGKGDETVNNDVVTTPGLEPGPVIKSYTLQTVDDSGNKLEWYEIKIKCNNPTTDVRTQQFQIIDGTGLSRTISLTLRRPWQYSYLKTETGGMSVYRLSVAEGISRNFPYQEEQPAPQNIGSSNGQELTLYFNLPDGMPETMFPLDFKIEAKYQGIENNPIDNMVVTTGQSLYNKNVLAISYIKTVSFAEYSYLYDNDTTSDVDINRKNTNHTIACRFKTITKVDNDSEAEIMVYNEYFRPNAEVKFNRTDAANKTEN